MNNSKLKSAFGIDDILCSRSASKSPPLSKDKNTDYTAAMNSANLDYGHGQTNIASEMFLNGHQPKKPLAIFPSTMDFAKNGFYMPGLTTPFSPSTYLEQYASALQKGRNLHSFCCCCYLFIYLPKYVFRVAGVREYFSDFVSNRFKLFIR